MLGEAMVVPNLITYSTTLMAFEKANHWQEGFGTSMDGWICSREDEEDQNYQQKG